MSLSAAALGVIIGSVFFAIIEWRILLVAITCLVVSTLAFTTLSRYRLQILSCLTFLLFTFFNYNLRSEHLEYFDIQNYLNGEQNHYAQIISRPRENYFYQSEFIIELKSKSHSPLVKLREWVLPYRLLATADSSKALMKGDILELGSKFTVDRLKDFKRQVYRREKVFYKIKTDLSFLESDATWIDELQAQIKTYYYSTLAEDKASIISSLLLGGRVADPPKDFIEKVRQLGLGHFFAASGFHLLVLSMFSLWVFKLLRLPIKLSNSLSLLIVFLYSALAGFSPSVIRAAVLLASHFTFELMGRSLRSVKFLVILAGMTLFFDPFSIFDIGFQFSYLATLAILLWGKPIHQRLSSLTFSLPQFLRNRDATSIVKEPSPSIKIPGYMVDILAISLAVQVLLLPMVIFYFNSFQVWTILANLLFTPLLSSLVLLSFVGASFLLNPLVGLVQWLVNLAVNLPFIDLQAELSVFSLFLLFVLFNLLMYYFTRTSEHSEDVLTPRKNELHRFLGDKYIRRSLPISIVLFLLLVNLKPMGVETISIKNGQIHFNQESMEAKWGDFLRGKENHKYFVTDDYTALAIKDRKSLKTLGSLLKDLRPVHLLILPKLKANDIYFDSLLNIIKPEFIITSSKTASEKAKYNLELLTGRAHTILNSGEVNIVDGTFWSLRSL